MFIAGIVFFAWSGRSWWWFALLLLAPDLFMVGYASGPGLGAALYNLGHALVWPMVWLTVGVVGARPGLTAIGAIWLAHIGMDRAFGFGLKHPDAFQHTHLGPIGKKDFIRTTTDG